MAHWQAVRRGVVGRRGAFEVLADHLLPGKFDQPDFALQLARKHVALALEVGKDFDVPMPLGHLTLTEFTEALGRGWATETAVRPCCCRKSELGWRSGSLRIP